jgi:hypothetical protein
VHVAGGRNGRLASCQTPGCTERAAGCSYVDRRGRRCETAWCWDHGSSVEGVPYCRRHASTVLAVAGDQVSGLPDVDNRAASLVSWVGDAISNRIQRVLSTVAPERTYLASDPVRLQLAPKMLERRQRRWVRVWKVSDHTGVVRAVSIEVDEQQPTEIRARVDGRSVGHGVPPWIALRNPQGPAGSDQTQRQAYYNGLMRSVSAGLLDVSHKTRTA